MRNLSQIINCILLLSYFPYAQKPYTLEECYQLGLKNNTEIKRAANQIDLSVIDLATAKYSQLPSLSSDLGHFVSFGKNIDPVSNVYVREQFSGGYLGMGLNLKVFSGFNTLLSIRQSKYNLESAEHAKKNIELKIMSAITLAYGKLIFNKEHTSIIRRRIAVSYKELDVINELIKAGRMKKYELYTFNSKLNAEQADLTMAQNDSMMAAQELKLLLNTPYNENLDVTIIDTSLLAHIYSFNISLNELLEKIVRNHPLIKQTKANVQAARLSVKMARSNYYPSVFFGANLVSNYNINQKSANGDKMSVSKQLNNNFGENLDISIHVPIFSQRMLANRVKKEKINLSNAELANTEAMNEVYTNILTLINSFNAAKQSYKASLASLEQSTLSYNMYEEKYRLGLANSLELITAKDILSSADDQFLQSKLNLFLQYQLFVLLNSFED